MTPAGTRSFSGCGQSPCSASSDSATPSMARVVSAKSRIAVSWRFTSSISVMSLPMPHGEVHHPLMELGVRLESQVRLVLEERVEDVHRGEHPAPPPERGHDLQR